jgi:hypothetical protein
MSKSIWITPEEAFRKKKMKKTLIYVSIMIGTVILSAVITMLANQV